MSVFNRFLVCFAVLLLVVTEIGAVESSRLFDYQETTLDNGLKVVTMEDFSSPIVAVQVWYHVGSKDENPNRQGFAHMFEHMMFRGTDVLEPEEHSNLISSVGGYWNAFTSFDYTAYVNTVPSNQLELALWLEAERMMYLDISAESFETERNVIKEERTQNLNSPYGTIPEQVLSVIIQEHPYRWTPIGKIACLEAADIEELRSFWDTYYVPSNATVVIVGAVSHEKALASVKHYFDWIPKLPEAPKVTIREPEQTEGRSVTIKERLGPLPGAAVAYRGLPARHPDHIALDMARQVLARGNSSRMYLDLVKDHKISVVIQSLDYSLEQDGAIGILGGVHPIKYVLNMLNPFSRDSAKPLLKAFDRHITDLRDNGITEHELEKVKNRMKRDAVVSLWTVWEKANYLGRTGITYGDAEWLNRELAAIDEVTCEDVKHAAQKYMTPERRTVVRVFPDKKHKYDPNTGLKIEEYEPSQVASSKSGIKRPASFPKTPPIRDLVEEVPSMTTSEKVLSNGLKVVVVSNSEVPFVTSALYFNHAAWTDDPQLPGVASMTLGMLDKGTENYTANELADLIEFNALSISGSTMEDTSFVKSEGLVEKLPTALELLAEVVRRPTFPKDELRLYKRTLKVRLKFEAKTPRTVALREFFRRVCGDHPYATHLSGTRKSVGDIKQKDLTDWWQAFVRPDTATLYMAGDITPEKGYKLAEKYFGDWENSNSIPSIDVPSPPEPGALHIYLIDNPDARQSEIVAGQIGPARDNPDRLKSGVLNQIFGGSGFGTRLMKVLRVEQGLTYGANGGFRYWRFGTIFMAKTFTRTESTVKMLDELLGVIRSMDQEAATDEELQNAKSYLVGRVPMMYETPQDIVNYLNYVEMNGYTDDELQRSLEAYKSTDADDIQRIADENIDVDKLTIVIVGDANVLEKGLQEIGPVSIIRGRM